jgi:hypothetical protein
MHLFSFLSMQTCHDSYKEEVSTTNRHASADCFNRVQKRQRCDLWQGINHLAPSIRKKLALISLTSGGRSVGMVPLRTEATELKLLLIRKQMLC